MEIRFPRPDGKEEKGWLSMPQEGENAPSVILIHEWWGINDQLKKLASRLSEEGFRAFVPDLYGGESAKIGDADKAAKLMTALDRDVAVSQVIAGAVRHLKERGGGRVAIMGFCMGGALAMKAAAELRDVDAAIAFYPTAPNEVVDPRLIRVPFQIHISRNDEFTPQAEFDKLQRSLQAGGVNFEMHRYDGPHAFMNEQRPDKYTPTDAKAAWDRALVFLESTIGGRATAEAARS